MEGLVCQNKDLKEDPSMYREPMEVFKDWGYMVILAGQSNQLSSSVLGGLEF